MNPHRLVIFDLDGTLVDAYGAIIRSFNYAMRACGYAAQEGLVIHRAVGWGDRLLLKPFVRTHDLPRVLAVYRRYHARALRLHTRLLPGVKTTLTYLKKKGYTCAIASNRPTRFARIIVKHLKLNRYIDYMLCADTLPAAKPHPLILRTIMHRYGVKPAQTWYVGDMALDAQTGRRARVRTVIVATGSSTPTQIRKEKPFKMLRTIAGLRALL